MFSLQYYLFVQLTMGFLSVKKTAFSGITTKTKKMHFFSFINSTDNRGTNLSSPQAIATSATFCKCLLVNICCNRLVELHTYMLPFLEQTHKIIRFGCFVPNDGGCVGSESGYLQLRRQFIKSIVFHVYPLICCLDVVTSCTQREHNSLRCTL